MNGVSVGSETQRLEKTQIILTGITTSQINQALKADNPYPAWVFLQVEGFEQDIPVFFRLLDIKDKDHIEEKWTRPKIKTGSLIECWGYFANSDKSKRPSFTAYNYRLLAHPSSQKLKTQPHPDFIDKAQETKRIKEND